MRLFTNDKPLKSTQKSSTKNTGIWSSNPYQHFFYKRLKDEEHKQFDIPIQLEGTSFIV